MKNDKSVRRKVLAVTVTIATMLMMISAAFGVWTLAKYVITKMADTTVEPAAFVFRSDLANGSNTHYDIYTDTATVIVYNYHGVNHSGVNIAYTVSVTPTSGGTYSISSSNGTLLAGDDNSASVTLSNLQAGKSYTVTISSSSPYIKTLCCTFDVKDPHDETVYSYSDNGSWGTLKINVGKYAGVLYVNYGSLSPDNTNSLMSDWGNGDTGRSISVTKYSYYELIFFEHNGDVADVADTIVTGNAISFGFDS